MIDVLTPELLGGHVRNRPNHGSLGGDWRGLRDRLVPGDFLGNLGQPEVEHLHATVPGEHHVGRLEVAVDDALVVGGGQRIGDGDAAVKDPRQGKAVGGDDLVQALAFDQFHREKAHAGVFLHGIERDDVRMVQARDRLRFALEALEAGGVGGHVGGKDLEGNVAVEARVAGAVHLAHPSGADEGVDFVRTEPGAGGKGHGALSYQREHSRPELLQKHVLLCEHGKMTGPVNRGESFARSTQ